MDITNFQKFSVLYIMSRNNSFKRSILFVNKVEKRVMVTINTSLRRIQHVCLKVTETQLFSL
jgi:hypothetical protein